MGRGLPRRPGYVLVAVLIVIVVLSLAAYRFADSMTGEYRAGARVADAAQARAAAVSGIHYAASMLADPAGFSDTLGGDPTLSNPDALADVVVRPGGTGKEARFSIVTVAMTGSGQYEQRYAMTDEGGKLNINALIAQDPTGEALYNALIQLPLLADSPEIADAIVDWVDADDIARTSGAESSYYQGLSEPYKAKNGPLNSYGELLMIRGVTPQLLYGTDQNLSGSGDRGLLDYVTVFGRELNVGSDGTLKVYINQGDPNAIYAALQASGIGDEMTAYVMGALLFGTTALDANGNPTGGTGGTGGTGTNSQPQPAASLDQLVNAVETKLSGTGTINLRALNSLLDLVNTSVSVSVAGANGQQSTAVYYSPLNDPGRMKDLLPALLDRVTTKQEVELIPRVNVNTAPQEVLLGLPGKASGGGSSGGGSTQGQSQPAQSALTTDDVDAILAARNDVTPGSLEARTGAWMLTSGALTIDKFRAIEQYATGSSMVYRVQSVGYLVGGGPAARVEAVVDTNLGMPRMLYFRDLGDLDSPRAFPNPTTQQKQ